MARPLGAKSNLQKQHDRAIELRFIGKTYQDIAVTLTVEFKRDFREQTVRYWFSKNGMLQSPYLDYAEQENDRRRQLVLEEVKKLIPIIPKHYEKILDFDPTNLAPGQQIHHMSVLRQVLKDLCEILGFKVTWNDDGSDSLDDMFERLERMQVEREKRENNPELPPSSPQD